MGVVPDPSLRDLITALSDALRPHLEKSASLRDAAAVVGEWLTAEAERARQAAAGSSNPRAMPATAAPRASASAAHATAARPASEPATTPAQSEPATAHSALAHPEPALTRQAQVELRIGDVRTMVAVPVPAEGAPRAGGPIAGPTIVQRMPPPVPATASSASEVDLLLVAQRCDLKADACDIGIRTRAARAADIQDAEAAARAAQIQAAARALPECVVWGMTQIRPGGTDASIKAVAQCFRATAAAARLVHGVRGGLGTSEQWQTALQPLATAHSMLRVALHAAGWSSEPDLDQLVVHHWLRSQASERRAYLHHMSLNDAADPERATAVLEDAERRLHEHEEMLRLRKRTTDLLNKIAYHRKAIEGAVAEPAEHDLLRIQEALEALMEQGLPESDRRIRDALGPVAADQLAVRTDLSAPVRRAVGFAQDALGSGAGQLRAEAKPDAASVEEWSPEVLSVRRWIAGRDIVLVGGEIRQDAKARIEDAFRCRVEWIAIREHASAEPIRAPATRSSTALVAGLVRLASHAHIDFAKEVAATVDKPFVFLPAGYNPEQIAHEVMEQVGRRVGLA